MLATQCMINLGEIPDPVNGDVAVYLDKAEVFIDLLDVLRSKTTGNLSPEEDDFLREVLSNIRAVYEKKGARRT